MTMDRRDGRDFRGTLSRGQVIRRATRRRRQHQNTSANEAAANNGSRRKWRARRRAELAAQWCAESVSTGKLGTAGADQAEVRAALTRGSLRHEAAAMHDSAGKPNGGWRREIGQLFFDRQLARIRRALALLECFWQPRAGNRRRGKSLGQDGDDEQPDGQPWPDKRAATSRGAREIAESAECHVRRVGRVRIRGFYRLVQGYNVGVSGASREVA